MRETHDGEKIAGFQQEYKFREVNLGAWHHHHHKTKTHLDAVREVNLRSRPRSEVDWFAFWHHYCLVDVHLVIMIIVMRRMMMRVTKTMMRRLVMVPTSLWVPLRLLLPGKMFLHGRDDARPSARPRSTTLNIAKNSIQTSCSRADDCKSFQRQFKLPAQKQIRPH